MHANHLPLWQVLKEFSKSEWLLLSLSGWMQWDFPPSFFSLHFRWLWLGKVCQETEETDIKGKASKLTKKAKIVKTAEITKITEIVKLTKIAWVWIDWIASQNRSSKGSLLVQDEGHLWLHKENPWLLERYGYGVDIRSWTALHIRRRNHHAAQSHTWQLHFSQFPHGKEKLSSL